MKCSVQRLAASAAALLLLFTSTASAQEVTQADTGSQAAVIVYEHTIGRGKTHEIFMESIPSSGNFTDVNNSSSNVFIANDNIVLTLYDEPDLTGASAVLNSVGLNSLVSLGFNDKASSYAVTFSAPEGSNVIFHEHISPDFGGWSYGIPVGQGALAPFTPFPDDNLSAVTINDPNLAVVLYEDKEYGGAVLTLDTVGVHDLEALGFNDIVSSFEIRGK